MKAHTHTLLYISSQRLIKHGLSWVWQITELGKKKKATSTATWQPADSLIHKANQPQCGGQSGWCSEPFHLQDTAWDSDWKCSAGMYKHQRHTQLENEEKCCFCRTVLTVMRRTGITLWSCLHSCHYLGYFQSSPNLACNPQRRWCTNLNQSLHRRAVNARVKQVRSRTAYF